MKNIFVNRSIFDQVTTKTLHAACFFSSAPCSLSEGSDTPPVTAFINGSVDEVGSAGNDESNDDKGPDLADRKSS